MDKIGLKAVVEDVNESLELNLKPKSDLRKKWIGIDFNLNFDQLLMKTNTHLINDNNPEADFEQEKCRRLHCEQVIQEQNDKILQLEERLAVAYQIDTKKNEILSQIRDTFDFVSCRCEKIESDNLILNKELEESRNKFNVELESYKQKTELLEDKLSKVVELLFQSQEKLTQSDNEKKSIEKQLKNIITDLDTEKKSSSNLQEKNRCLSKEIDDLKISLEAEKNNSSNLSKNYQTLEHEMKNLKNKIDSEREKFQTNYKQKCDELKQIKNNELLELEKKFNEEILLQESKIMKLAAEQIKQLCDKNQQEIELLEEKHKEEIKLFTLSYHQNIQKIETLQIESLRIIKNNFKSFDFPYEIHDIRRSCAHMIKSCQLQKQITDNEEFSDENLQSTIHGKSKNSHSKQKVIKKIVQKKPTWR